MREAPGQPCAMFTPPDWPRIIQSFASVYVAASTTGPTNRPTTPKLIKPPMTPATINNAAVALRGESGSGASRC